MCVILSDTKNFAHHLHSISTIHPNTGLMTWSYCSCTHNVRHILDLLIRTGWLCCIIQLGLCIAAVSNLRRSLNASIKFKYRCNIHTYVLTVPKWVYVMLETREFFLIGIKDLAVHNLHKGVLNFVLTEKRCAHVESHRHNSKSKPLPPPPKKSNLSQFAWGVFLKEPDEIKMVNFQHLFMSLPYTVSKGATSISVTSKGIYELL